ncbi:MAG: response regulator [Deltaproteobacteria bacterium]|nr:response regulator [Deltaproteobacteria bacterium]
MERLRRDPPDVLITDYFLGSLDGGKLCQVAKAVSDRPVTTVILTGGADRRQSRAPSPYADAVVAKNALRIVLADLRRVLGELSDSLPPPSASREVVGHQRLEPRTIARKLHGLKQYLDALHEGIGDAVIGVDRELRAYFLNTVAAELIGTREEDALARPLGDLLGLDDEHPLLARAREALGDGPAPAPPLTLRYGTATLRVTVSGLPSPDGQATAVVIARDVSDLVAAEQARIQVEARLHHADKLSSLGHLVASVSHEINNPLAAILLDLHQLGETLRAVAPAVTAIDTLPPHLRHEFDESRAIVAEATDAAGRIREIVDEMRLFAHPGAGVGERVRVEDLLDGALGMVSSAARFRARIERRYEGTPAIVADRSRLGQAFLNVLLNAVQAIGGNDPDAGLVRVATSAESSGIVVEISNNGPPIDAEAQRRIFEPFFTTKPIGEGVGLGLAVAHETLRRHGGHLEVESSPGALTTFRFHLPLDTGLALEPTQVPPPATPATARRARLLVIDDDRLVLNGVRRVLEGHHDVSLAPTGARALELLAEGRFDLVLCDLIMPGMAGMEVYDATFARAPNDAARFVFLTGGTSSVAAREFLARVPNPRAFKPVPAEELARLVDRCLAALSPAG